MNLPRLGRIAALFLLLAVSPAPVIGGESVPEPADEKTDDSDIKPESLEPEDLKPKDLKEAEKISIDDLELKLKPLQLKDLETTIAIWLDRVADATYDLCSKKIEVRKAEGEEEKKLIEEQLDAAGKCQDRIVSLANTVIASITAKGGDADAHRKYIEAATDITPDIEVDMNMFNDAWMWISGWAVSDEGGLQWAKSIAFFLAIIIAAWLLSQFLGRVTNRAIGGFKNTSDLLKSFFVNTVRKVTLLIGIVMALSIIGVDIGPLVAAIGVVGFVIGFALQGTLSNFACGIMILLYRPYDIGDAVEVAGVSGSVEAMTLVSTTIKSWDNQRIVVPNNSIWGGIITNITGNDTRRVDMVFGIGYGDDIAKAQGILEDILSKHEQVLADPAFVIKVHELADSSVNFIVRPWTKTANYWNVYWDVTRAVKERFDAEEISIPFPQQDVHMHQVAPA